MDKYIVVRDENNGNEYIDKSDTMIRFFETVLSTYKTINEAKKNYPKAIVIKGVE